MGEERSEEFAGRGTTCAEVVRGKEEFGTCEDRKGATEVQCG